MKKMKITLITLIVVAMMAITTTQAQQAGDIDTTWADSGWLIGGHVPENGEVFRKIRKLSNNRFMLIGETLSDMVDRDMLLVMYNADGTLHTDFGNQGVLTIDLSLGMNDGAFDLVELWDGKFLVAGATDNSQSIELIVMRLMEDGTLDYSFGTNGIAHYDGGPNTMSFPTVIAVSSSNNIFVGAQTYVGDTYDFSVLKFTQGGGADSNFGNNGIKTIPIANSHDEFKGMHITEDEDVIVIGNLNFGASRVAIMFKLHVSGEIDTNWTDEGSFAYSPSAMTFFNDLYVDDMGSIYVVGHHGEGDNVNGFIRKFGSDGLPDVSFATNGKITMDIGVANGIFYENIKMITDGNFIVTGKAFGQSMSKIHAFAFDASGSGDCEISCAGVYHDFSMEVSEMSQDLLEIMDDGSIITGGSIRSPDFSGTRVYLTKLLPESQTVSVDNHTIEKLQLSIYPNPTSSEFYIKNIENLEIIQIRLFALDGRMVQQWNGSRNSYPIDQAIPTGNYIAHIISNKGVSSQLITVSK